MTVSTIDEVLSILADGRAGHKGAMGRAMGILVATGHAPLVRRCCAVWARHAVLRWFQGPAPYDRILRRSCRIVYRYASERADDRDIYIARCQAEMTARDSTGVAVEVARAVARACAFPGMPDSMEADAPPGWFAAAF